MSDCVIDPRDCGSLNDMMVKNEDAIGATDCTNLSFRTTEEFVAGSLCVYMDGVRLPPDQYTEHIDSQGFTLVLDPVSPNGLNKAPSTYERMAVDYLRNIASSRCVVNV